MQFYLPLVLALSRNKWFAMFCLTNFTDAKGMEHIIRPKISWVASSPDDSKMQDVVVECYNHHTSIVFISMYPSCLLGSLRSIDLVF
jgi:hypothetical protein